MAKTLPTRRQLLIGASTAVAGTLLSGAAVAQNGPPATVTPEDITNAEWANGVQLSQRYNGVSLLVEQSGVIVREAYPTRDGADRPWNIFSGTKGLTALYASILVADGILDLDELCADTFPQWRSDARKRLITPHHLLTMTSGISSRNQTHLDSPNQALERPCISDPGTAYVYGPAPIQCFAALVRAKLTARGADITDPQDDLKRRLLAPLGIVPARWDRGAGGIAVLAVNCHLTARQWARVGRFVLDGGRVNATQLCDPKAFARIFEPTPSNICYGMNWWVSGPDSRSRNAFELNSVQLSVVHKHYGPVLASGGYYAQRLILLPERDLVIVRQARGVYVAAVARDIFNQDVKTLQDLDLVGALLDRKPGAGTG